MTENKRKINACYIAGLTIILLTVFFVAYISQLKHETIPVTVKITSAGVAQEIYPWYDDNGKWYFFIPSYADLNDTILCSKRNGCYLQNSLLDSEQNLDCIEMGIEYDFERHGIFKNSSSKIVFLKSANVPTMYVKTVSGNMSYVHADKSHKESISVALYDEAGGLDYESHGKDIINGRGNSTWGLAKKPYKITLQNDNSFLGMGESKDWVLLANGFDETNLRNKLIFDFAKSMAFCWTPSCEYVDLYVNGVYNGLYLLTEKIEISSDKLNINFDDGDYLFECFQESKLHRDDCYFKTDSGRLVRFHPSTAYNEEQLDEAKRQIVELENNITHGDLDRIDSDSWVYRFLIDEFFENVDIDQDSSYFYFSTKDNLFYSGPIWDYDLSMATDSLFEGFDNPNQILSLRRKWYGNLYKSDEFYNHMVDIYQTIFLPSMEQEVIAKVDTTFEKIRCSAMMNEIRWEKMFMDDKSPNIPIEEKVEKIKWFLNERVRYLEQVWCSGERYKTVSFLTPDGTVKKRLLIKQGEIITEVPDNSLLDGAAILYWHTESGDEPFDFTTKIYTDISLYAKTEPSNSDDATKRLDGVNCKGRLMGWLTTNRSFAFSTALCFVIIFTGAALIYVDVKRNGKGDRNGAA